MTIKPADYDLRELRRMADEDEPPLDLSSGGEERVADDLFRLGQREELLKLQTRVLASGSLPEKPYLRTLRTGTGQKSSSSSGSISSSKRPDSRIPGTPWPTTKR